MTASRIRRLLNDPAYPIPLKREKRTVMFHDRTIIRSAKSGLAATMMTTMADA